MFSNAYTFGRFNIPHNGHLTLFQTMAWLSPNSVIGVSTGKNNLPLEERLSALRLLYPQGNFVPLSSPFAAKPEALRDGVIVLGQDQASLGVVLARHYGVDTWFVARDESAPSSTACRQAFAANDIPTLTRLMPSRLIRHYDHIKSTVRSSNALAPT